MGCGDEKLSKYLTQTFIAHCNAMICQQVTLSGDAEWPKVADAMIEADNPGWGSSLLSACNALCRWSYVGYSTFTGVHMFGLTVRSFWKFISKNWKFSFEEQRT